MNYRNQITKAMTTLALDSRTIFVGQSVCYPGHAMFGTLENVPMEKRIEMPVAEDFQMGLSIGLALMGYIPISIYPRWDFLILATNQLINHLDKMEEVSNGQFKPKIIIRTMIGSSNPLNPGPQHRQDYTEAYKKMLTNVDVIKLTNANMIESSYLNALHSDKSTIIVEVGDLYK